MQRSGWRQRSCRCEISSPDVLEARITSGAVRAPSFSNSSIFTSSRSGAASWTNSAPSSATARSSENESRLRSASFAMPSCSRTGHACSTMRCKSASAPGPGSVAETSRPRDK